MDDDSDEEQNLISRVSSVRSAGWDHLRSRILDSKPTEERDVVEAFKVGLGSARKLWAKEEAADPVKSAIQKLKMQRAAQARCADTISQIRLEAAAIEVKRSNLERDIKTKSGPNNLTPEEALALLDQKMSLTLQINALKDKETDAEADCKHEKLSYQLTETEQQRYRIYRTRKEANIKTDKQVTKERGVKAMKSERALKASNRMESSKQCEESAKSKMAHIQNSKETINEVKRKVRKCERTLATVVAELTGAVGPTRGKLLQERTKLESQLSKLKERISNIEDGMPKLDENEKRGLRGLQAKRKLLTERQRLEESEDFRIKRMERAKEYNGPKQGAEGWKLKFALGKQEFQKQAQLHFDDERSELVSQDRELRSRKTLIEHEIASTTVLERGRLLTEKFDIIQSIESIDYELQELKQIHEQEMTDTILSIHEKEAIRAAEACRALRRRSSNGDRDQARRESVLLPRKESWVRVVVKGQSFTIPVETGTASFNVELRKSSMKRRGSVSGGIPQASRITKRTSSVTPVGQKLVSSAKSGSEPRRLSGRRSISIPNAEYPEASPLREASLNKLPSSVFIPFKMALFDSINYDVPYTFELPAREIEDIRTVVSETDSPQASLRSFRFGSGGSSDEENKLSETDTPKGSYTRRRSKQPVARQCQKLINKMPLIYEKERWIRTRGMLMSYQKSDDEITPKSTVEQYQHSLLDIIDLNSYPQYSHKRKPAALWSPTSGCKSD